MIRYQKKSGVQAGQLKVLFDALCTLFAFGRPLLDLERVEIFGTSLTASDLGGRIYTNPNSALSLRATVARSACRHHCGVEAWRDGIRKIDCCLNMLVLFATPPLIDPET